VRYSLLTMMLMTAWLGSHLGIYVANSRDWRFSSLVAYVVLTWVPIVVGLTYWIEFRYRARLTFVFLAISGVLYCLSNSCRLVFSLDCGVHLAVQMHVLSSILSLAGVLLYVFRRWVDPLGLRPIIYERTPPGST